MTENTGKIYQNQPISQVLWVPLSQVQANDYNPNSVARKELELLYLSIKEDGYTQPVVTYYDKDTDKYIIVDGFHRYRVMCEYLEIYAATDGHLPIVVIDKSLEQRKASTVRHNRARGKHSIAGMSNLILSLAATGKSDTDICTQLGLEIEELTRLKYVSGFAKLYAEHQYNPSWETEKMIQYRVNFEKQN